MATLSEAVTLLNTWLSPDQIQDYSPNGLQVEGRPELRRVLCGVTASQALIDAAIAQEADAILVHHGWFWKGEPPAVTGQKARRLRSLLTSGISLIAYHLPLDVHPELGNNATLARELGLTIEGQRSADGIPGLFWFGRLPTPMAADAFGRVVSGRLDREALLLGDTARTIQTIGWCTGGAQDFIDIAVEQGLDAFLSGEVSERTYHTAVENNLIYIGAGHHATERYGIQALGRKLAAALDIPVDYFEIPNPV